MAKTYFTMAVREADGTWAPQFGSWQRSDVYAERYEWRNMTHSGSPYELSDFKVLKTDGTQAAIDAAVAALNADVVAPWLFELATAIGLQATFDKWLAGVRVTRPNYGARLGLATLRREWFDKHGAPVLKALKLAGRKPVAQVALEAQQAASVASISFLELRRALAWETLYQQSALRLVRDRRSFAERYLELGWAPHIVA